MGNLIRVATAVIFGVDQYRGMALMSQRPANVSPGTYPLHRALVTHMRMCGIERGSFASMAWDAIP